MTDNGDDYDFNPSNSSKLASLFGITPVPLNNELNSSLIYKPPKQPSSQDSKSTGPDENRTTTVFVAKVVSAWKADHKEYKSCGRLGLALIGSSDLNLFEIIGYKEKSNIIFRAKVNTDFSIYNRKDCFSTFYDNVSQNWLIKFDGDDQTEFSEKIGSYGASILKEQAENQEEMSENVPVKPQLIPHKPDVLSKPVLKPGKEETQLQSSDSQKKAEILTRMAKMGQQILPELKRKNSGSDISESDIQDDTNLKQLNPRKVKSVSTKDEVTPQGSNERDVPVVPNVVFNNQLSNFHNTPSVSVYSQPLPSESFNNYVVAQNAELKINLIQMSAKLDTILNNTNLCPPNSNQLKSKIKCLELKSENLEQALNNSEKKYASLKEKYDYLREKNMSCEIRNNKVKEFAEIKLKKFENIDVDLEKYDLKRCKEVLKIQTQKLQEYETYFEDKKSEKERLEKIGALNRTVENLNLKLKDFEGYSRRTESDKQNVVKIRNENINKINDLVKMHMNDMYQLVSQSFDSDETYTLEEIEKIVAKQFKKASFKIIEGCVETLKGPPC